MTKRKETKACAFCGKVFNFHKTKQRFCSAECRFMSDIKLPIDKSLESLKKSCWLWTGSKHKFGYGEFRYKTKLYRSHIFSYDFHYTGRSKSMHVLHKCDNPSCCNPQHLFLGTQADNMADMSKKGRSGMRAFTDSQIRDIRMFLNNGITQTAISELYNVSQSIISSIKLYKTYKHIK